MDNDPLEGQANRFLHEGALAHFRKGVRTFLNQRHPNPWIGRGPIAWPPRSPDLNPMWGFLKVPVHAESDGRHSEHSYK